MKERLSLFLTCIFLILSALHFYWLFGGQWGFSSAIPTSSNGNSVLNPSKIDILVVALGLLLLSLFYLTQSKFSFFKPARWMTLILGWLIPVIFFVRAIGDFQYVGFFKGIVDTEFARLDTAFYSPLCLVIALLGLVVISKK
jgi:glucan phosphoethanolaminetransferase (alkaline phosphatase superfamily)